MTIGYGILDRARTARSNGGNKDENYFNNMTIYCIGGTKIAIFFCEI